MTEYVGRMAQRARERADEAHRALLLIEEQIARDEEKTDAEA